MREAFAREKENERDISGEKKDLVLKGIWEGQKWKY
jgi:hypothetical protein